MLFRSFGLGFGDGTGFGLGLESKRVGEAVDRTVGVKDGEVVEITVGAVVGTEVVDSLVGISVGN